MFRRLTVGLRYKHDEGWTGGVYYVRNLVRALDLLPERIKPRLVMIGGDKAALNALREATGYRRLTRTASTRIKPVPPARRSLAALFKPYTDEIDVVLLGSSPGLEDQTVQWVPDLQEDAFPEFFGPEELKARRQRNVRWFGHSHVMLSSQAVADQAHAHYGHLGARLHVVPFASFVRDEAKDADPAALRARYGLPERYFICSNQLWKHKNHALVLRALAALGPGEGARVVFTGREEDPRDPAYALSVKALATALGVEDRARFLGFLPRTDQLGLIEGAVAVIQPSLCEGWSTVVEDAKALGRPVLASDIPVHREQLGPDALLFAPDDPAALAALLRAYGEADPPAPNWNYPSAERRFACELMRTIRIAARDFRRRRLPRLKITPTPNPS
jgi:glycosyltransferase involved in cell wall biosynthesis